MQYFLKHCKTLNIYNTMHWKIAQPCKNELKLFINWKKCFLKFCLAYFSARVQIILIFEDFAYFKGLFLAAEMTYQVILATHVSSITEYSVYEF